MVRKKPPNAHPPLRRVVDVYEEEFVGWVAILSCGHKAIQKQENPKKLGDRMSCDRCAAVGDFEKLPQDCKGHRAGGPRYCARCGCRLRTGQRNSTCDPCRTGRSPVEWSRGE